MSLSPVTSRYVTVAFVLGFGAAVGLAAGRAFFYGVSFTDDEREHPFFYLYTAIATTSALAFLAYRVGRHEDALRRSRARFEDLSNADFLTHLANARAFAGHYRRLVADAEKGEPISLLLVDVDELKKINDTCGHATGNEVLRQVGAVLGRCKRTGDVAARWGGDEFALLLRGASPEVAVRVARSILDELGRCRVEHRGRRIAVSVTIGVASTTEPSHADVFALADGALLEGKASGRNRVLVAREGQPCVTHPDGEGGFR